MPVPSPRNKILPARGNYADLAAEVASIADGEICYAVDQDQYYQNESGTLVAVGATKAQGLLADSAVQPGDNVSELVNDAGYITLAEVPADVVTSVAGRTGDVTLVKADVTDFADADYATAAQGLLADSATQPGDNISTLANDAGYITSAQVPADAVTSVNSQTGVVVLDTDDISDAAAVNKYTTEGDITKLAGIESGATADQTGAEIKTAYEAEADTNAFTDTEKTKLSGIADGAEVNLVTSVAGKTGAVTLNKSDVGLSNVDNTSDANKPISTATATALGTKADLVGGVLDISQIPDIAISEYKGNVADETAMLAVTGEKGDWVIRDDDSKVYVITGDDSSVAGGWTALAYPAGFSGAYADLTGKPTLGTAAATDATDYATAAQGSLADSATQPGDNVSTLNNDSGYITSAPGTNLSYTASTRELASSTGSNATLPNVAAGGDSGLMTGSDKSKLDGIASGATNVTNNNQLTNGAGYVTSSGNTVIGTGSDINTSGAIVVDQLNMTDGVITSHTTRTMSLGDLGYTGATNANYITNNNQLTNGAGYITSANGGNAATLDSIDSSQFLRSDTADQKTAGTLRFNDNVILSLGTSDDAEFFCNGSHFYLDLNSGIGNFYIRDGSTTRFTFDDNGNFTATGSITAQANVTAYSDINLKENIEVIPNALEKVSAIRGVTYDRKDLEGARHAGVIAQEVEAVLPEVIQTDEEGIKSVAYGNLVGLLIEAVKELKAEIEDLKK